MNGHIEFNTDMIFGSVLMLRCNIEQILCTPPEDTVGTFLRHSVAVCTKCGKQVG